MGISSCLNFEKRAGNASSLNYSLHLLLKACIIWLQSIFGLLFSPYMYSGHLLKAKLSGQFYKSSSFQCNIRKYPYFWAVASQFMDFCCSGEITILFPLPFKLFAAQTTKLYPTVQHKWTAIQWAGKKIRFFTHIECLELMKMYKTSEAELNFPTFWGLVVQAWFSAYLKAERYKNLLPSYLYCASQP